MVAAGGCSLNVKVCSKFRPWFGTRVLRTAKSAAIATTTAAASRLTRRAVADVQLRIRERRYRTRAGSIGRGPSSYTHIKFGIPPGCTRSQLVFGSFLDRFAVVEMLWHLFFSSIQRKPKTLHFWLLPYRILH